jgi:hypothetical protein
MLSNSSSSYIDEPPFIDTDIGRGLLLFTLDDYSFFLEDTKVSVPNFDNML